MEQTDRRTEGRQTLRLLLNAAIVKHVCLRYQTQWSQECGHGEQGGNLPPTKRMLAKKLRSQADQK